MRMANDPVLIAYGAPATPGKRRYWKPVGRAFPHEEGAGLTLVLDAIPSPFDGRLILLEPDEADDRRYLARIRRLAADGRGTKKAP